MARNNLVNMIGRLSEEQVVRLKCDMCTDNIALLNNRDGFPVFQFGKHTIRFRAPYSPDMCEIKKRPEGRLYRQQLFLLLPGQHGACPDFEQSGLCCNTKTSPIANNWYRERFCLFILFCWR